ncbi:MAG: hypothetical protein R3F20_02740 [Planctomycetota bacterium]
MTFTQRIVLLVGLSAALLPALSAQVPGVSREQMWYAPTEEDWAKPCLIEFQRTWDDALAVAKETGKPILICVNMDGEIASEHYAGVRYRMPEIAKLYEPYVCVIASTYRHTPRDHDEHGHRILCPRFGSVTCGEHIGIEPILFDKYFEGQRVAPRHIMVELDGQETYDVFYAFDTDSVFKAIEDGIVNRKLKPNPVVKGDRSIVEKVKSADNKDRREVEKAFADGDAELRAAIMAAAKEMGDRAPTELLRLAVMGFDETMNKAARDVLAKATDEKSIELIGEALRAPLEDQERQTLISALDRIGEKSERARTMSVVHKGLGQGKSAVDVAGWKSALVGASYRPALDEAEAARRLDRMNEVFEGKDASAKLDLAEAFLKQAEEASQATPPDRRMVNAFLADAAQAARDAEKAGAKGWRPDAILATTSWYLGDVEEARRRAVAAASQRPEDATDWKCMVVLGLFAEQRREAIRAALREKREWPKEWMTDVHAAYAVLAEHPFGTPDQVVAHYDFLVELDAKGPAAAALEAGVRRFPARPSSTTGCASALVDKGVKGLEETYEALLREDGAHENLRWFAGYASIMAAEYYRRDRRGNRAIEAYGRAIAHYDRFLENRPEGDASADQYAALALGGRGRVHLERRRYEESVNDILAAFRRSPNTANQLDGLNLSSVDTAKMLVSRLKTEKLDELGTRLQAGLDALDPSMLALPAFEGVGPSGRRPRSETPPRRERRQGN